MRISTDAIWAIDPIRFAAMSSIANGLDPTAITIQEARDPGPVMEIVGRVAVIEIDGPMTKRTGLFQRIFGGASTLWVREALMRAAESKSVDAILLRIDSPGGSVDGLSELGDTLWSISKPKVAQIDGMAASAAYYVASQADQVYANRMDLIGSIGTRLMLYDWSRFFANAGVEAIPIDTGEFKSAGALGTEITDEQRADFQRVVDDYFADFQAVVARGRKMSTQQLGEVSDGRMWTARDAVGIGLIDGIQGFAETLAQLQPPKRRGPKTFPGKLQGDAWKAEVDNRGNPGYSVSIVENSTP